MPTSLKDKVPPNNLEAEQATLGALLLDPDAVFGVSTVLGPEDFYQGAHQKIYRAIISLYSGARKADLITLIDELKKLDELDGSGGAGYIAGLTDTVPSAANVAYYAGIVKECSLRRGLLRISQELKAEAHDETKEARRILEDAQKLIFDLTSDNQAIDYKGVRDILQKTIEAIEKACQTKEAYTGVPTGFRQLDEMTSGFQKSELIIIGARPSVGKTALALSMAAHIAIKDKRPAGFFTLEMPDKAIMQRLIASEGMISSQKLRTGLLKTSDYQSLLDAAGRIYEAPLYIADLPNIRLLDLRTLARRMVLERKVEIIFIDYLTLVASENADIPRHEQIAEISRSLKALARELNVPLVVLSQVKRESEGKRPTLADLRESGSIEQDADVVMFLHRERETDGRGDERAKSIETELIVAKQRNGPIGTVTIGFLPEFTKFVELARERT